MAFFAKQFIQNKKRDMKITNTNHYILLTNVCIERCIIPSSNHVLRGGGEEFQPDKYLTDTSKYYPSHMCYKLIKGWEMAFKKLYNG